ncbi:hypothetical protein EYF80_038569 [Liparis tanakae]|uniref:Uncharacterized protein n=1 Tax=Liparis tanakae TaxID=230148 RepID=A0A4Z2GD09_9TELE|nr:hypothetical protein EYF80_038569 [Liparis tanakae]
MTGDTTRGLRLCLRHMALLRRRPRHAASLHGPGPVRTFGSPRYRNSPRGEPAAGGDRRRGVLWKTLVGVAVAVPVAVGVRLLVKRFVSNYSNSRRRKKGSEVRPEEKKKKKKKKKKRNPKTQN